MTHPIISSEKTLNNTCEIDHELAVIQILVHLTFNTNYSTIRYPTSTQSNVISQLATSSQKMRCLTVKCHQCGKVTNFDWCFENDIILFALKCKKCYEKFILEQPKQKTENIITHIDFLPFGEICPSFHLKRNVNTFHYGQLSQKEIKLPILELSRTIFNKSNNKHVTEDGLIQLEDVEAYINQKF